MSGLEAADDRSVCDRLDRIEAQLAALLEQKGVDDG